MVVHVVALRVLANASPLLAPSDVFGTLVWLNTMKVEVETLPKTCEIITRAGHKCQNGAVFGNICTQHMKQKKGLNGRRSNRI